MTVRAASGRPSPRPAPLSAIRLVATDLDGTLLNSTGRISPRTREAVRAARRAGVEVAYLTSRPPQDAAALLADAGIAGFLATCNGAMVQGRGGEVIGRHTFTATHAVAVVSALRGLDLAVGAVTDRDLALDPDFPPALAVEWRAQTGSRSVGQLVLGGEVLKLLAAGRTRTPLDLTGGLALAGVEVTRSTDLFLEVSLPAATKGRALGVIAHAAGVELSRVACVGDMPNDLSMFRRAGLAVAVANAGAEVRDAAGLLVASNDQEGVAEFLVDVVRAAPR